MKKLEASTHVRSVYGMIELRGYITDEPNGNSNGQPVLIVEKVIGELPPCFNSLVGKYAPEDIFEAVLRPEMAPNVNQTYPQPVNFSPVHLRKPPRTKDEIKLARKAFVNAFSDNSGFRPGIETIGWLYGEAAKKMFEQPNVTHNSKPAA
ncbi:MAG: hypothetical protein PVG35_11940 [Desulfobacterales bacterium]